MRIHKFIANAGVTSRRKAERLILEGRVSVNGQVVARLGTRINPQRDHVKVDGRKIHFMTTKTIAFALYKPKSCVTTLSDPQGRRIVADFFPPSKSRLFPVGRLDYDAEGLIIITNDGLLSQKISHPRHIIWKTYFVKIKGIFSSQNIGTFQHEPKIDGKKRSPVKIKVIHHIHDKTWLEVSLREGTNRHIKKMFFQNGFPVLKIKRYRIGIVELKEMSPGDYRALTQEEIQFFMNS